MKIYLAGPMRGHAARNFPAFDDAEKQWRAAGHHPVSPASVCRALCQIDNPPPDFYNAVWEKQAIDLDIRIILSCDAIALLPNWEQSKGATVEVALAQFLDMKIYDALHPNPVASLCVRLDIPTRPWLPALTRQLENSQQVKPFGTYPSSPLPDSRLAH